MTSVDGSCLQHIVSCFLYGQEGHADKMRAWMVLDAIINKKQYLDHERLVLGSYRLEEDKTCNLLLAYAKMYGKSGLTRTLIHEDIEEIYE